MTTVQLKRDPFARASLMRYLVPRSERKTCAWCGQPARFRYTWEADSILPRAIPVHKLPQFCSAQCSETFGGGVA